MITVSDAWKDIQQRFLVSESHIEIDCTITDEGAQEAATIQGADEATYSDAEGVLGSSVSVKCATNELNFWALDGTRTILPTVNYQTNTGYVSNIASTGSVIISFPVIRQKAISGVTITWGALYGEYPTVFTVTGKNGATVVAETTITDNKESTSVVFVGLENYDSITITVHNWNVPYRRVRIEKVLIGHSLTFTKQDLLNYKHEQNGDLLSGSLPKNSIEFTLDNSDGRWNPNNPTGMQQYLTERQKLVVRYGLEANGTIEWIDAGTFYLAEWNAPSNGLEAHFVARDVFEFLINSDMKGASVGGNLAHIVRWASNVLLPDDVEFDIDGVLENTPFVALDLQESVTAAEIVQKCANAARCVLRYDRKGILHIEPLNTAFADYKIPLSLSYTHPEVTLLKPLKKVSVDYGGEAPYELTVSNIGEVQTARNEYLVNATQAALFAEWVKGVLGSRKTISGEFRADPRLDLFDIVVVESKYGELKPVAITNITYTFNGSFRGSYVGRVLEEL